MKEKVEFLLVTHADENADAQVALVGRAFDLSGHDAQRMVQRSRDLRRVTGRMPTVICTLAQFAKFMIIRHELGLKNRFMELSAHIVAAPADDIFDVRP